MYLPFTIDITDTANFGDTENVIAVKVNNWRNPDVPGINNFGGIYRDVWLHITDELHVTRRGLCEYYRRRDTK